MSAWLPDMDLNHDKQIQSLLCYRYTIGQTRAFKVGVPGWESRRDGGGNPKAEGVSREDAKTLTRKRILKQAGRSRGDAEARRKDCLLSPTPLLHGMEERELSGCRGSAWRRRGVGGVVRGILASWQVFVGELLREPPWILGGRSRLQAGAPG
jgi:hypothetical protein